MRAHKTIFVPVFLVAQGMFVHWTGTVEKPPAKPDTERFPIQVGAWQKVSEQPLDASAEAQLGADIIVNSMFMQQPQGDIANLFVAWFQSQRSGASQPHSPQVCLPAAGWIPESTGLMDLETSAGTITVNRYVVARGEERAVVLYWYQTPRRVIAGEWAAKFWLMADALRDRRTDTALVRVTTWVGKDSTVATATALANNFSKQLYPLLRETLPR